MKLDDFGPYLQYLHYVAWGAGVIVAAAILWWILKSFMSNGGPAIFTGRDRRRLGLVEWTSIGGGRQLLLVRRDNVEHLILTGGPLDVVVESGIGKEPPAEPAHSSGRPRYEAPFDAPAATPRYSSQPQSEPQDLTGFEHRSPARSADHSRDNGIRHASSSSSGSGAESSGVIVLPGPVSSEALELTQIVGMSDKKD